MKITPGEVEVVSNKSKLGAGAIPISSLNPDRDGDGKIEKWEQEVFDRIKAADADQSGSISVNELFSVIKGAADADKAKRLFQKLLMVSVLVITILVGSMLAVSIAAGEMVKESHVKESQAGQGDAMMMDKNGRAIKVDVAQSEYSLFDLPSMPQERVATIERLELYINTTGHPELGNGIVWSTFLVSSAIKFTEETVAFYTPSGSVVNLDATTKTGTITMDGVSYPVSDEDSSDVPETTPSDSGRRRLRRGRTPSLRTRGRFFMSMSGGAAGGAGRRQLQ